MALGAIAVAFVLVLYVLFSGGGGHSYKFQFETGGQLVTGNQVLVGRPADRQDQRPHRSPRTARPRSRSPSTSPCTRGPRRSFARPRSRASPTATSRSRPGANSEPELEDGAIITSRTDHRPGRPRPALQHARRRDPGEPAEGHRGLGDAVHAATTRRPARPTSTSPRPCSRRQRLLAEITRDQSVFSEFLGSGSRILGAVAERRNELASLTPNANQALAAIAAENEALDRSLAALPPALRQANTTFVNLRAALDDLDPLVETSKKATVEPAAVPARPAPGRQTAVPVVNDLRTAVANPGPDNDLTDVARGSPRRSSQRRGRRRTRRSTRWTRRQDEVEFARPYTPELLGLITSSARSTRLLRRQRSLRARAPSRHRHLLRPQRDLRAEPMYAFPDDMFDSPRLERGVRRPTTGPAGPRGGRLRPLPRRRATQPAADGSTPFLDEAPRRRLRDVNDRAPSAP